MSTKYYFGSRMHGGRQQFPGIRWWPVLGIYGGVQDDVGDVGFFSETGYLPDLYDRYVLNGTNDTAKETAYLNLANPSRRSYFVGGRKYRWRDMLKDETVPPSSRQEARDPNWGNYKWNLGSWNGITGVDPIGEAMDSAPVAAGKAKVFIFVATTATAERNPIPSWVMTPSNNTIYHYEGTGTPIYWRDPDESTDENYQYFGLGKDHLRLDKQGGVDAMTDWLIALVRKYGTDPRMASIIQGEYYPNDDEPGWVPVDLDLAAYRANVASVWREVIRVAPRDKDNNRVALIQGQPITSGNYWTPQGVEEVGVGASGSGVGQSLFNQTGPTTKLRKHIYRKVPSQHQINPGNIGEAGYIWPSSPVSNPFGFVPGDTFTLEYQHVCWFCSGPTSFSGTTPLNGGPTPLDSLFMRDQDSLRSQWHTAYGRFGPNGSDAATWGQIPNFPQLYS